MSGWRLSLIMIMGFHIQLSVALMTGALGMVLTRVLSIDEAYQAVDWRTIFLLAGLIPLGIATEKTGRSGLDRPFGLVFDRIGIAHRACSPLSGCCPPCSPLVISNVGATVLLVPPGGQHGPSPPTSIRAWPPLWWAWPPAIPLFSPTHQVNALYMGPGRYRTIDFIKAGSVVSIVFLVVMIAVLALFYGI